MRNDSFVLPFAAMVGQNESDVIGVYHDYPCHVVLADRVKFSLAPLLRTIDGFLNIKP